MALQLHSTDANLTKSKQEVDSTKKRETETEA